MPFLRTEAGLSQHTKNVSASTHARLSPVSKPTSKQTQNKQTNLCFRTLSTLRPFLLSVCLSVNFSDLCCLSLESDCPDLSSDFDILAQQHESAQYGEQASRTPKITFRNSKQGNRFSRNHFAPWSLASAYTLIHVRQHMHHRHDLFLYEDKQNKTAKITRSAQAACQG